MVHFNFKLDDNSAENLMDCVQSEIESLIEMKAEAKDATEVEWCRKRIRYFRGLKRKMKNHKEK